MKIAMISKNIYFNRHSWLTFRSALFADNAAKSTVQHLIENVLGSTRQYLRAFFKNKVASPSEIFRKQSFLISERFIKPSLASKLKFTLYRPGSIHRLTSRWCSNPWTDSLRADLLKKFYRGGSGPLLCFVGFSLAKKPSLLTDDEELEGVSYLIRDLFSSLSWGVSESNLKLIDSLSTISLDDLKIGELIAKGCNAAIYSACLKNDDLKEKKENVELENLIIKREVQETVGNTTNFRDIELLLSHMEGKQIFHKIPTLAKKPGLTLDN